MGASSILEGMKADSFEKTLIEVINRCLSDLLGDHVAQAMNFYLDPRLAASSPDLYARRLASLAGQSPSGVILRRIEVALCARLGVAPKNWGSFAESVNQLKACGPQVEQSSP